MSAANDITFDALFQSMSQGVVYQDAAGVILLANPAAEAILGLSLDEMQGRSSVDPRWRAIHTDGSDFPGAEHPAMLALRSGQAVHGVVMGVYHLRKDETRWIRVDAVPEFRPGEQQPYRVYTTFSDISAQYRAERELQERESFLQTLLQSGPALVVTHDLEGRLLYANRRWPGQSDEAFHRSTLLDAIHPDFHAAALAAFRAAIQARAPQRLEQLATLDGQAYRWVDVTYSPVLVDGAVRQVAAHITDIHDRKLAAAELLAGQEKLAEFNRTLEKRVQERSQQLLELYDSAPCGYHSIDGEGSYVMINQTELDWLGYTRDEMVGKLNIREVVAPENLAEFESRYAALKSGAPVREFELEYRRKDGSRLPVLLNGIAVLDEGGDFVMSRTTVFDITERKKSEAALLESEQRLNFILSKAPAMIFTARLEPSLPVTYVSESLHEIMGYDPNRIRLQPDFWMHTVHPDDLPGAFEKVQQALEAGRATWVARLRRASGDYRWFSTYINLLTNAEGLPAEIIGITTDVHEQKLAEAALIESEMLLRQSRDELRAANAALESAARLKDEFLANISHELRTPLNGILGLTEILANQIRGPLNEHQQRYINMIDASGRQLLEMINGILDLASIEAGKFEFLASDVLVEPLCRSALEGGREKARLKNISLALSLPEERLSVFADPRRVRQMLDSLLDNAIKFTAAGGQASLEVRAAGTAGQGWVEFRVHDTGIGIAIEDLERIFEPFVQVDGGLNRRQAGAGLGLALVQKLAEQQGGSVRAESTPGQGSCFILRLPRTSPAAGRAPVRPAVILLAEDNDTNRLTVTDFLVSLGYQLVQASNGREALARLEEQPLPNLVLMDIQMPEMDGLEAIRRMRADARFARLPVVALTSLAMPGDEERCRAAGASAYMSKPMNLRRLAELVARLIQAG